MRGRILSISGHVRDELATGWELASASPNAVAAASELEGAGLSWIAASVPSTAASVLRAAGSWSLDGPARRFDAEDIWYRVRFAATPAGPAERVVLCLDGLATIADAWLNDAHVLSSESMFIEHEVDVGALLREHNLLVLRFRSLDPLLAVRRPRPRWRAPMVEHQQLRWFRTTLLGRTPGWSPPAAAAGPWRAVRIERRAGVIASDVRITSRVEGEAGVLDVSLLVEQLGGEAVTGVELGVERGQRDQRLALAREGATSRWSGRIAIDPVERWWPHTHGEPALYRVSLRVVHAAGTAQVDLGAIGFRELHTRTEGGGFSIVVNGVRTFCRGACWMPLDPARLHAEPDEYELAIAQVVACGMNMLRVSGTTIYESDAFFDACDRAGVLVWQDFMFANMDYPGDDERFASLVEREALQLLARMQGRPSLAVLCGNSEGEQQAAMWGASRELWSPPLFHETLARIAAASCPTVPYWPSSAHGGAFPHQNDVGTTSYYGVGAYLRPLEDARRSELKFATECLAFANVPEPHAILKMPGGDSIRAHHPAWKARAPRDLGAGWDFEDVRDHYLGELFDVDPSSVRASDHERYLALSRVVSGEVMASVFSEWRRARSVCGGGLVWFLRDLWYGAGWGLVDAGGVAKAPYFYLRRALQPVQLSLSDEGTNGVFVHAVNDGPAPLRGVIEVSLHRAGAVLVARATEDVVVPARGAIELAAASLFEGFCDTSYAYRFGPPGHDLVCATLRPAGDGAPAAEPVAEAFFFPVGRSATLHTDIGLAAVATPLGGGDFDLVVRTRAFAMAVCVESENLAPDDNYFHLAPGAERRVRLRNNTTVAKRSTRCTVQALNAVTIVKVGMD